MGVKNRNPIFVLVLSMVTLGIYALYWIWSTRKELNSLVGKQDSIISDLILFLIPVVNFWAIWVYAGDLDKATKGAKSGLMTFIFFFIPLLNLYNVYSIQTELNKLASE